MIELVCGRAGSGKSRYIRAEIARRAAKDPLRRIVVICPEQYTFQMEREITGSGIRGTLGTEVLSFSRLTRRILRDSGFEGESVDASVLAIQLSLILSRLRPASFKYSSQQEGFELSLLNTISELKRYDITPEMLKERLPKVSGALAQKLTDITAVYESLQEMNAGRYDAQDQLNATIERIPDAPMFSDFDLIVDGFDMMTAQIKRMLFALIDRSRDCVISFRVGAEGDRDAQVFAWESGLLSEIEERAASAGRECIRKEFPREGYPPRQSNPALAHLEKNLFAAPYEVYPGRAEGVSLTVCRDMTAEIRECARRIYGLTRERYRFSQIAVAAPASYVPLLYQVLCACDIPCFADGKHKIVQNPLYVFLDSAAALLCGNFSMREVRRFAKSGLCGITAEEADILFAFMREYGIRAYALKREFGFVTDRYPDVEDIRRRLVAPLFADRDMSDASGCAAALFEIMRECGAGEKLTERIAMAPGELLPYAEASKAAAERIAELLRHTGEVLSGMPMSMKEFRRVFAGACRSVAVSVIPPTNDEVAIVDMAHSLLPSIKAMFVLGASEGGYDPPEAETALPEREARRLREAGIDFMGREDTDRLRADIYSLFTKPSEELHMSCTDGSGVWIAALRACRILGVEPRDLSRERIGEAPPHLIACELAASVCGGDKKEDEREAYAAIRTDRRSEAVRRALFERREDETPIPENVAARLYGGLTGSVSRLEEFSRCPFRHFAKYGLKLMPPRDFDDDPQDWGSLLHCAMDMTAKRLSREDRRWGELSQEEAGELSARVADAAFSLFREGYFEKSDKNEFFRSMLREQVSVCVTTVARQLEGTKTSVLGSELVLGSFVPIYRVPLADGRVAEFSGVIDRADVAEADGRLLLRVVDYKSSDRKLDLSELFYGVNIQLMTYLMVLTDWLAARGEEVFPAGAYYFDLSLPFSREDGEELLDKKRMSGVSANDVSAATGLSQTGAGGKLLAVKARIGAAGLTGDNVLTPEDFEVVFAFLRLLIADRVERIAGGEADTRPYTTESGPEGCGYCPYAGVCLYDGRRKAVREAGMAEIRMKTEAAHE